MIDTHAHILPKDWPDLATQFADRRFPVIEHSEGRHRIFKDGKFFREVWPNSWDPTLRIEEYAAFGVHRQVISTVPVMFSYWAEGVRALALHRALNEHMAEVCETHPQHYFALATVPAQSPKLAITELERCKNELGLHGVQLGSHINEWNLDAPELFELFAAAEALSMAVMIHPWDMMGQASMPKYWLPWLVGMPAEQSRAACALVLGGVLERLPKLRVLMAHGGGAFPYTIGRIEHGFKMRPDLVATDSQVNPRAAMRNLYFDCCVHDPRALDYLIDTVGLSQMMLGTDYPFPLGEQHPGASLSDYASRHQLQADHVHALQSGNALRWLGLAH